ncbi:hypothetical protein HDU99_000268 [Rhizoclosmatium hyalinum]|nr:hypothetical protein HDU99_000268 [Rhizoclosmatium hyalinum]
MSPLPSHSAIVVVLLTALSSMVQANPAVAQYPSAVPTSAARVATLGLVTTTVDNSTNPMQTDTTIHSLYSTVCAGQANNAKICVNTEAMFVCNQNSTVQMVVCPTGFVCCHGTNTCNPDITCGNNTLSIVPSIPTIPTNGGSSDVGFPNLAAVTTTSGFCKKNKNKPLRVGYITSWGQYYQGNCKQDVSTISKKKWTHLIYAFGAISGNNIVLDVNADLPYVTKLRAQGIKIILSVGGWGAASAFVGVASSSANRQAFAASAMSIFTQYGFDGIDLDWEFPTSYKDTNGKVIPGSDGDNLAKLIQTLRNAFRANKAKHYTISLAVPVIPTVYNYPLADMAKYCDFVNVMTYDLNGPWDSSALPNTDNRIIKATFQSLLKTAKFPANKLLLGLAYYGRTYKLASPSTCNGIGCAFISGATSYSGACSQSSGYVYMNDIQALIDGGATQHDDVTTGTSWLITSDGSWVTYDSLKNFK